MFAVITACSPCSAASIFFCMSWLFTLTKKRPYKLNDAPCIVRPAWAHNIQGNEIRMRNNLTFNVGENYKDPFTVFLSGKLLKKTKNYKLPNNKPSQ